MFNIDKCFTVKTFTFTKCISKVQYNVLNKNSSKYKTKNIFLNIKSYLHESGVIKKQNTFLFVHRNPQNIARNSHVLDVIEESLKTQGS